MPIDFMNSKSMQSKICRRILITGGTSGIGLEACKILSLQGHHLTLLCRTEDRCHQAQSVLTRADIDPRKIETMIMDLNDLHSIEDGCTRIVENDHLIDTIVLNAGIQNVGIREPKYNDHGIEETFCVNHLAHQLILIRLLPLLLQSKRPRLVITSSEVHNPISGGGRVGRPASLGKLEGLRQHTGFEMIDGRKPFDADKAYKDSKLCNILMAREVSNQLQHKQQIIPVIAWSPGLVIPRTNGGLFRISRQKNPIGIALFAFIARDLLRLTETLPRAGSLLADLSQDDRFDGDGFRYFSNVLVRPGSHQFKEIATSTDAEDEFMGQELWRLSERLIMKSLKLEVEGR